jgi:hypothetical protein
MGTAERRRVMDKLTVVTEQASMLSDAKLAAKAANQQRFRATRDRAARDKLTRESHLTTAPKYRMCECGCGVVLLWSNPGYHPIPEDLGSEVVEGVSAVSKAQVYWARAELKKVEAGGYSPRSYEELKALAATPLEGLPDRAPKKERTKAN